MKKTDYEKLKNYVNIDKFSHVIKKIYISYQQRKLIESLLFEMKSLTDFFKNNIDIDFNLNNFLLPLLYLESESTSLIEGTNTKIEDFAYDVEEINNIPQWESRNLITIYQKYLLNSNYFDNIEFSTLFLKSIHIELYKNDKNSKFKMTYDPSNQIEKVKPGKISFDDNKPNFIGFNNNMKEASLIMLKPSLKKDYLDDFFEIINSEIKNESFLIDHIILSHVIFEGIHPFNDGNGIIGRFLIALFFKKAYDNFDIPLFLSEAFLQDKEKYKQMLLNVQLKNDNASWNDYIFYFIDRLIFTKKQLSYRIRKIVSLYQKFKDSKATSTEARESILNLFFKYMKINKKLTIKKIKEKFSLSEQAIYDSWNIVIKILKIKDNKDGYYIFTDLEKILRKKIN